MTIRLILAAALAGAASMAAAQEKLQPPIDCATLPSNGAKLCAEANDGNVAAIVRIAQFLSQGPDKLRNDAEAVRLFRFAADRGNADGQAQLAFHLGTGRGIERNPTEAVRLYRLAAGQGHLYATSQLGAYLLRGIGVERNAAEGVRLLRIVADKGDAVAQIQLAFVYEAGDAIPRNDAEAARLYRLSAGQNYTWAIISLAYMHAAGRGTPRNPAEAVRLLREVVQQKPAEADYLAGAANILARTGLEAREAREWAERAYAISPKTSFVARTLALVLAKQGQAARAAEIIEAALPIFDADCWACFDEAGDVFAAAGRKDDARRHWARALELWPEGRYARYSSRGALSAKLKAQ